MLPGLLLRQPIHLFLQQLHTPCTPLHMQVELDLATQSAVEPVVGAVPEQAAVFGLARHLAPIEQVPLESVFRHAVAGVERAPHISFGLAGHVCIGGHELCDGQGVR